jgi:hypothetical protein
VGTSLSKTIVLNFYSNQEQSKKNQNSYNEKFHIQKSNIEVTEKILGLARYQGADQFR